MSLSFASSIGKVKERREIFNFVTPSFSFGNELIYRKKMNSSKEWQNFWRNPTFILSSGYYYFNSNVLGTAIYTLPGLSFDVYSKDLIDLSIGVKTGIGYITKKYNQNNNPQNNAIGSNWNNAIALNLQGLISNKYIVSVGLLHFSNGSKAVPNRGINAFNISLEYILKSLEKESLKKSNHPQTNVKKYGVEFGYRFGVSENNLPNGPKYGVHTMHGGFVYKSNSFIDWIIGVDYEYNYSRFNFAFRDFSGRKASNDKAKSITGFVAANLYFGKVVAHLQTGGYIPVFSTRTEKMYSILGLRYYLKFSSSFKPYIGFSLKSHFARAESVGLDFGFQL